MENAQKFFHNYDYTMYATCKKFSFDLICTKIILYENFLHEYLLDQKSELW